MKKFVLAGVMSALLLTGCSNSGEVVTGSSMNLPSEATATETTQTPAPVATPVPETSPVPKVTPEPVDVEVPTEEPPVTVAEEVEEEVAEPVDENGLWNFAGSCSGTANAVSNLRTDVPMLNPEELLATEGAVEHVGEYASLMEETAAATTGDLAYGFQAAGMLIRTLEEALVAEDLEGVEMGTNNFLSVMYTLQSVCG